MFGSVFSLENSAWESAKKTLSMQNITIMNMKCGYMEAPVNYKQKFLRLGGNINFKIGDIADENYPQIVISLEDNGNRQKLWDEKYIVKQNK